MKTRISACTNALALLCLLGASWTAHAQQRLVLDDFEDGVDNWSTNDKLKTGSQPATQVEVTPKTGSPLVSGSQGGGMFTFTAAKNSWASASLRVDGEAWAKIGARSISFYLNAGGNPTGFEVLVRRTGTPGDEVFRLPWPVRLDVKNWRKVVIPLSDFKSDKDKVDLTKRLGGVYLLQFVMRGSWDARFFTVDNLIVEGTGKPIPAATPAPKPTPTPKPTSPVTNVGVDFLRLQGKIRTGANISVGATTNDKGDSSYPLNDSADYRSALRELKVRYIRLDAGQYAQLLDSSRLSFDFSRLQNAVIAARALNAQPLVAITNPSEWNLDAKGYASFASQVARAVNARSVGPVRNFDLACGSAGLSGSSLVSYYNPARAAVRKAAPAARVGGPGCTIDGSALKTFLRSATGLDFLTVQDFGAAVESESDESLMQAARGVERLKIAAKTLDASRWKNAGIYVIANLNSAKAEGQDAAADGRTIQMISCAWWGLYVGSASRLADQVFHSDAARPEWGFVDDAVRAYPAYYCMWMWNTYVPTGSTRVATTVSNGDVWAMGFNTSTAHNVLLVNTQGEDRTAQISIRGFPVLRSARMRIYDDPRAQPNQMALPKSPYQTVKLKPYATAIVQFIEPPKR